MKLSELKVENLNIDIDKYIEFRELVKSNMEYPDWLGDFSKIQIEDMLATGSKIWIYYDGDIPVCSMMMIPSTEKDINKFGLDLDYRDAIDYGPQFVNYSYVGNGLQYQMLKALDEYVINEGYRYAISTVHPDNIYSSNNLVKDGFSKVGTKEFKRGIRDIYVKELKK